MYVGELLSVFQDSEISKLKRFKKRTNIALVEDRTSLLPAAPKPSPRTSSAIIPGQRSNFAARHRVKQQRRLSPNAMRSDFMAN